MTAQTGFGWDAEWLDEDVSHLTAVLNAQQAGSQHEGISPASGEVFREACRSELRACSWLLWAALHPLLSAAPLAALLTGCATYDTEEMRLITWNINSLVSASL